MTRLKDAVVSIALDALSDLGATLTREEVERVVSRPPNPELGDVALGVFPLAKQLKRPPPAIASDLAKALERRLADYPVLSGVAATGPYVNFRANLATYAASVLPAAIAGQLGHSTVGAGQTIVVDFSSPNLAKPFGIGHLRSTAIGGATGRLLRAQGYTVIGINHVGDWGTQFGKLIVAWNQWGNEEAFVANPILHLYELYVRFHKEEADNPAMAQEGRDWFRRLEEGDEEARAIWSRFRGESLAELDRMYGRIGVSFERVWGEAFYEDKVPATVERIRAAGILEESEGAQVVHVEQFYPGTGPCLILRTDGASLYATRDLAAAIYRYEQFQCQRMLYFTSADQADHFKKVFGVLKRMGFAWANGLEHVPFGRIHGISTRKGTLVILEDVFDRARELALEIMRDRDMPAEQQQREAEKIGIGAVIFFDLSKERIKDADFSWDAILQVTGRTGPMLQYTQVRLKSLLAKYQERHGALPELDAVDYARLAEPEVVGLMHLLADTDDVVARAAQSYEPALLSRHLLDLADAFNGFYSADDRHGRIVTDDVALSAARITLCRALLAVLTDGLTMLGVPLPDRM